MFIHDFFREVIRGYMEDPQERDRKFAQHVYAVKAAADRWKENMRQPTKSWGYWKSPGLVAQHEFNAEPALNKLPGRGSKI